MPDVVNILPVGPVTFPFRPPLIISIHFLNSITLYTHAIGSISILHNNSILNVSTLALIDDHPIVLMLAVLHVCFGRPWHSQCEISPDYQCFGHLLPSLPFNIEVYVCRHSYRVYLQQKGVMGSLWILIFE